MTQEEFLQEHNGSSIDLVEVAYLIREHLKGDEESEKIVMLASGFISFLDDFEEELEEIGFEFG